MGRGARGLVGPAPEATGAAAAGREAAGSEVAGGEDVDSGSADRESARTKAPDRDVAPTWFLLAAPAEPGTLVTLPDAEANHARRVLRLTRGALVPATDGRGGVYRLRLLPRGRSCDAEVLERSEEPPEPGAIEVGVGAGRRERFLWCVEKLTELGVARVVPLLTSAVQASRSLHGEAGARYASRARARAAAALKQSKGTRLPEVEPPRPPLEWARRPSGGVSLVLAFPAPGVVPLAAAVARCREAADLGGLRLAVGPEGGFSEAEQMGLVEAGFVPVHLGERRLRFETAAVVAVGQVRAVLALAFRERALEDDAWTS